jgi:hypothetical protein
LLGLHPKPHITLKGVKIMSNYKQVKVNFKPEEFVKLEEFSRDKNMTKAEYIRQKLDATIGEPRQPRQLKVEKVLPSNLLYELKKIGTNVNQIATIANTNKALDRQILSSLVRIEELLKGIL